MIFFGTPRRHLTECGSTNDEAREWARDPLHPAPSGALVTAEYQTRGRGQRGRDWQAGPGESALMSFVYRFAPGLNIGPLGLVTALAIADALAREHLEPQIKWPNDILLDGRKVAGILVEAGEQIAILGIGINVTQEQFAGGDNFKYPPTSLRLATGQPQEITRVIDGAARTLREWETRWQAEGFASILAECRRRLAVGAEVRRGAETAILTGLSDEGGAQVRLPDGTFAVWSTVD